MLLGFVTVKLKESCFFTLVLFRSIKTRKGGEQNRVERRTAESTAHRSAIKQKRGCDERV